MPDGRTLSSSPQRVPYASLVRLRVKKYTKRPATTPTRACERYGVARALRESNSAPRVLREIPPTLQFLMHECEDVVDLVVMVVDEVDVGDDELDELMVVVMELDETTVVTVPMVLVTVATCRLV